MPRKNTTPSLDRLARTPAIVTSRGLSSRTLYRLAAQGRINIYKVGAVTYWSLDELDALVERRRAVG